MSEIHSESNFISPRISSEFVVSLAKDVKINDESIRCLSQMINKDIKSRGYDISVWKKHELHPKVADERAIDWIFVIDSLNFSFWPNSNEEYTIEGYTGYWALCKAINRALERGIPITDPYFYAQITEQQFKEIFLTDSHNEFPLLHKRLEILKESGNVVIKKFSGSFLNCVKESNSNAIKLLKLIVDNFESFRDETTYRQQRDIWGCFEGKGFGYFQNIDELTMFADYRVPQVLAYFNAIEYSERLKNLLKNRNHLLKTGDEYEVEIRAASIIAVERIKQILKESDQNSINSIIIDFYLWDYRRNNSQEIEEKTPFHRVRDIYY